MHIISLWIACAGAPVEPGSPEAPAEADSLIVRVCTAFDEVVAEDPDAEMPLSRAALRAVEHHGVTEAQLAELGARPAQLLKSIRAAGDPPECSGLSAALAKAAG